MATPKPRKSDPRTAPTPGVLYHYTSLPSLLAILNSGNIWATHFRYLNDSSEIEEFQQRVEDALTKMWENEGNSKRWELLKELMDAVGNNDDDLFITSFSSVGDDLAQWRAYCSTGAGLSIGFDSRALQVQCISSSNRDEFIPIRGTMRKVGYMEPGWEKQFLPRLRRTIQQIDSIEVYPHNYPRRRKLGAKADLFETWFANLAPIWKNAAFKSENEWRIIITKPRLRRRAASALHGQSCRGWTHPKHGASRAGPSITIRESGPSRGGSRAVQDTFRHW